MPAGNKKLAYSFGIIRVLFILAAWSCVFALIRARGLTGTVGIMLGIGISMSITLMFLIGKRRDLALIVRTVVFALLGIAISLLFMPAVRTHFDPFLETRYILSGAFAGAFVGIVTRYLRSKAAQ